jgi:hypothetical protein
MHLLVSVDDMIDEAIATHEHLAHSLIPQLRHNSTGQRKRDHAIDCAPHALGEQVSRSGRDTRDVPHGRA